MWERAWQDRAEAVSALGSLAYDRKSVVVMRYLLEHGCPVDHVTGYDSCLVHDLERVRIGGVQEGVAMQLPRPCS